MMVENDHYEISQDDLAQACQLFDAFWAAQTQKAVLGSFRQLCERLRLRPSTFPLFFPRLKSKLKSWKAQSLWTKIEKRASHRCYAKGNACINTRVLIIGGGPCGLRTAIEAQLCGAKVVVIEKRDRFSRNNVLHLWPYVIHDLKALGAKKFYGKFCAGSIDHISIRQLQCILLKISLLVGIEVHENVTFVELLEPPVDQTSERIGWRASVIPSDHPVSQYEFDVLVGADGKRNTLRGFSRKEFRGKLAIAITANFINRHSEAEARVEEISGVAFIFNQKFFKDLNAATGIDLENIVYYKDETHYFVMTAKKHSLISKGVILRDYPDTAMLLAPENVDRIALLDYAREAADFSTNYQLPSLDFAVNHYGQPDVAMFDFTSMYAAENACRVVEKRGHKLLMALVGDSLLEPFWPTGSGCARGFLGAFDAAWMMISWSDENKTVLQTIAEREGIYRLLAQTTPENLSKDLNSYSLDPSSRYPNFVRGVVLPFQVRHLYVTDNPEALNATAPVVVEAPRKKRRRDSVVHPNALLEWLKKQTEPYSDTVTVTDTCHSFKDGMALCCIIHRYRPNLLDVGAMNPENVERNNQLAFDLLEAEMGISPVMTGAEMAACEVPDKLTMVSYLSQVYECFRREIPHVPRKPELDSAGSLDSIPEMTRRTATPGQRLSLLNKISRMSSQHSNALGSASSRSKAHEAREHAVGELLSPPTTMHSNSGSLARKSRKRRAVPKELVSDREARKARVNAYSKSSNANDEVAILDKKVRNLEAKLMSPTRNKSTQKPKDMVRAIGKLDADDWNVRKIQGKIDDQKKPPVLCSGEEDRRVPKWSKDIFQEKLENAKKIEAGESSEESSQSKPASSSPTKPLQFDSQLKLLEKKLREGSTMEVGQRGANKVSAMAEQLASKLDHRNGKDGKPLQRSNSKSGLVFSMPKSDSEKCHFCLKRVYLMERHSTEGRFFHRGCFRCEYCGTVLRIGNYGFERDDNGGPGKFMCMQHYLYGTSGVSTGLRRNWKRKAEEIDALSKENFPPEVYVRKSDKADEILGKGEPSPAVASVGGIDGEGTPIGPTTGTSAAEHAVAVSIATPSTRTTPVVVANAAAEKLARSGESRRLHRVTTPERIEFENSVFVLESPAHHGGQSEEEILSEMDEDEWTDRNFGQATATEDEEMNIEDSDSELSDEEEPNAADQIAIEESLEEPLSADRTRKLAESWQRRHSEADVLEEDEEEDEDDEDEDEDEDEEDEDEETDAEAEPVFAQDSKLEQPKVEKEQAVVVAAAAGENPSKEYVAQAVPFTVDEDEETATADDYRGDMSEEDIPIRESGESLVSSSISSSSTSSSGSDSDSSDDEGTSTDIETDSELERNTDLKKLASHRRREASKEPIIRVHCKINGESTNSVRTLESSKSCDIGKLMAMSAARRKEKEQKMNEQKRLARPASPEHKPLAPLPLESLAPRHSASTTQLPSLLKLPVYESSRLADPRRYARSTFRLLSTDADPMVASTSSIPTSSSLLSSKILDQETKKLEQRVERNKSEVSAQAQAIIGNVAAENRRNRGGNASGANEKFSDFFAFISQNQKLLQPAPNPSPEIRAFLEGGNKQLAGRTPPPSPRSGVQLPVVEPEEKLEQQNGDHSVSATPCQKVPERRGSLSTNDSPTVSIEDDENVEDLEAEDDDLLNQAMNESDLTKGVMTTEDDSIFEAVNDIDTLNVTSIEGVDEEFDKIMEEEAENLDVAIQNFTTIIEGGAELETESADFDLVSSPAPEKEPAKLDEPRPEPEGDLAARFRDEFDSLEYMDANASLASATPSFKRPLQVFNPPDSLKNVKQAEIKEATPPKAAMEEVDDLEEEFKQEVVHVVEAVNETVVEAVTAASSPETEGPDSHLSMDSEELAALRREAVERDVTPGTTPSSPHKAQQQTLGVPSPEVAKPLTVNVSEPPPVPKTQPPNEEDDVELDNTTNWFSKQSPFGSIRDSIHVRKSNLKKSPPKDKSPSPQPLLNAAKSPSPQPAGFMRPPMAKLLSLPTLRSPPPLSPPARPPPPVLWETKEQEVMRRVSEDREKQKNLVREMVLSKIKSPENRRERKFVRSSPSFVSQESLASGGAGSVGSGQVTTTPGVGNGLKSGVSESNLSPRKISAPTPQTSAGSLISPDEFYTPMTSFRPALRRPVSMAIPASTSNVLATMDETPTTTVSTADVAALLPDTPLTKPDRYTLNTIGKTLFSSPDLTQAVAATPDRVNWDDLRVLRTAEREKARQSVRDQIRVKSDAELGLSPPNTIESLKDRIRRRNGPPSAAPDDSKLQQVKDFQEDRKSKLEMLEKMAVFTPPQFGATARSCPTSPEKSAVRRAADISPCSSRISSPDACSSAPVSVAPALTPPPSAAGAAAAAVSTEKRKKSKDPERRRSIIQLVHGLFSRSSADKEKEKQKNASRDAVCGGVASPTTSDLEAKAASPPLRSPKLKERASPFRLKNKEKQKEKKGKKKSTGPSPATTATPTSPSRLDDSFKALSLGEKSTLETPPTAVGADEVDDDDPLALLSGSAGTLTRRQEKIAKRLSRQAELKRLRMAQEIQRQLEELEVKQRELEERGVAVEKALRGEGTAVDNSKEETELMGEWFALVHEKTRLGRYEQELLVRAKELELEDRQARLQQNLRERLTVDDETKTKDDIAAEREILNEMVEIVEQRDTLLEMMEEDRLRYREEDKDLEAAMLAKGLQLTPIRKETGV